MLTSIQFSLAFLFLFSIHFKLDVTPFTMLQQTSAVKALGQSPIFNRLILFDLRSQQTNRAGASCAKIAAWGLGTASLRTSRQIRSAIAGAL